MILVALYIARWWQGLLLIEKRELQSLQEGRKIRAFCLNDGGDSHSDEVWNQEIPRFLAQRFPAPIAEETRAAAEEALAAE